LRQAVALHRNDAGEWDCQWIFQHGRRIDGDEPVTSTPCNARAINLPDDGDIGNSCRADRRLSGMRSVIVCQQFLRICVALFGISRSSY